MLITSVLGRFLRRCRLEYVQLDFDAACQLWKLCTQLLAPDQNAPVEIRTLNHTELAETAQGTVGRHKSSNLADDECVIPTKTSRNSANSKLRGLTVRYSHLHV